MTRKALFLAMILVAPGLVNAQVRLLRHPSYSKGKIAFSYLGDIWIAGENGTGAQRITDQSAQLKPATPTTQTSPRP